MFTYHNYGVAKKFFKKTDSAINYNIMSRGFTSECFSSQFSL